MLRGGGADILERQIQCERAAHPRRAAQLDFSTQQTGQFAADGEAEPRAAVSAACAGVCLLEGFEDDLLLIGGNADAGVGHLEGDDRR